MIKSSAEGSLKKIMDYLHRPFSAFNKYEALKMMDSQQHLAKDTKHERPSFYCLVYQTKPQKIQGKPKIVFTVVMKATSRDGVIPGKEISPCEKIMVRLSQPQSDE